MTCNTPQHVHRARVQGGGPCSATMNSKPPMVQTCAQVEHSSEGRSGQSACSLASCAKTVVVVGVGVVAADAAVADIPAAHEN